jgi:hypothetical protein
LPLLMLTVLIRRILIGIFPSFLAHYENWSFPELRAASLGGRERVRDATNAKTTRCIAQGQSATASRRTRGN